MSEMLSIGNDIRVGTSRQESIVLEVPSWRETEKDLSDSQRLTAENVFFKAVLKKSIQDTQGQLPWLRTHQQKSKSGVNEVNILSGLLDAQIAPSLGEDAMKKFRGDWGDDSSYLLHRVEGMTPSLDSERNKIFFEAKSWNADDEKEAIKGVYTYVNKIPKDQRQLLLDRTGLKDTSGGLGKTVATNVGIFLASEWPLLATGAVAGLADPLGAVGIENRYALGAILVGSYIPYVKSLIRAGGEDYQFLDQNGSSSTLFSKGLYEGASKVTNNQHVQKVAAHIGFGLWYAALELPYLGEAVGTAVATDKISSAFSSSAAATIAAGALTSFQADMTAVGRDEGINVETLQKVARIKYERNKDRFRKVKTTVRNVLRSPMERVDHNQDIK